MKKLIELGYDQFGIVVAKKFIENNEVVCEGDLIDVWRWELEEGLEDYIKKNKEYRDISFNPLT